MRKSFKKFLSLFLAIILLVCSVPNIGVKATAASDNLIADSSYLLYQASEYSKSFQQIFGGSSSSYANTYFYSMREDPALMAAISSWEAIHIATEPSYSLESGLITKRDMYKLVIFDLLDVNNSVDSISNEQTSYVFGIAKEILDDSDIDISELKSFEVTAEYVDTLNKSAKAAQMIDVIDVGTKIADAAANMFDAVNAYASYQTISNMKNGTKEILTAISELPSGSLGEYFNDTDLEELKNAAKECISYFDGAYNNVLERILNGTEPYSAAIIETAVDLAMDWAWDTIVSAIPGGMAVLTAAKGIRAISNEVFDLDDSNCAYYQLEADVAFENAIRKIMTESNADYTAQKDYTNASFYMQAVDMYKNVVLLGFDYSIDLLEIQASATSTQMFDWLTGNYSECISLINEISEFKSNKQKLYNQFENIVYSSYKSTLPDYDDVINSFNNQVSIKAESVSLTQIKNIVVGDKGYIDDFIKKTTYPENGIIAGLVGYTSENEDILKIDALGFFEAVGVGECTLTFDKYGDLKSSISITVGSGEGKDKTVVEIGQYPQSKVVDSSLIEKLNSLEAEWKYYNYYSGNGTVASISSTVANNNSDWNKFATMEISNYAKYTDIVYEGEQYRGINFSSYRPSSTYKISNSSNSYQDDNGYNTNEIYWFKYEPIKWIIIDEENNIAISEKILDSQAYNNVLINITNHGVFTGNKAYANSYSSSTLLSWLNNEFYDSAFTTSRSRAMITSVSSSGVASKVSLLGVDAISLDNVPSIKIGIGTDYAKSQGLRVYSFNDAANWRICDDGRGYYGSTYYYDYEGNIRSDSDLDLASTYYGVRPIIKIKDSYSYTTTYDNVTYNIVNNEYCQVKKVNNNPRNVNVLKYVDGVRVTSIENEAFKDCTNMKEVTIPETITNIGESAFKGCSSLETITIPKNVEKIEGNTFYGCTSLKSISLPSKLINISKYAFGNCTSLIGITIPDNVTSLGESAFKGCSSLEAITIPKNVEIIEGNTFYGCTSLKSISLPSKLTNISRYAFGYCSSLIDITIPDNVTSIGESAFRSCSSLESIKIPNKIKVIEPYTFYGCESLIDVSLSQDTTDIGEGAFYGCKAISTLSFPDSIIAIGSYAFYNCTSLADIKLPDNVTSLGSSAFKNCSSLESLKIPNKIKVIEPYTFSGCNSLSNILIPVGVTYIGERAFADCRNLSNVTIPADVITIDKFAFESCALTKINYTGTIDQWVGIDIIPGYSNPFGNECNLYINNQLVTEVNITCATDIKPYVFSQFKSIKKVVLGDVVETIGRSSFDGCSSLEEITIGSGLRSIGFFAFDKCSNLVKTNYTGTINQWVEVVFETYYGNYAEVTNPVGISHCLYINNEIVTDAEITTATQINDYAFINCTSLESVNIGNTITNIGNGAFYNCDKLEQLIISDGVTTIGDSTFYDCSSLTEVIIPNSVTSIGESAFEFCSSISNITLSNSLSNIEYNTFYWCTSLISITIPNSVTDIGKCAFKSCENLKQVNIGNNVKTIGAYSFFDCCALDCITMPKTVTAIDEGAFKDCRNLSDVFYSGTEDEWCNISISSDNSSLVSANLHYNTSKYDYTVFKQINSTCTTEGQIIYTCPHGFSKTETLSVLSHKYVDGVCVMCQDADGKTLGFDFSGGCIHGYYGESTTVIIPQTINGQRVTSIGENAFSGNNDIISVTIPDSVTSLGRGAFRNCKNLQTVKLSNNIKTIDGNYMYGGTFENCESLEEIIIPDGVTKIEEYAFKGCTALSKVIISENSQLEYVGDHAFADTAWIEEGSNYTDGFLMLNNCLIKVNDNYNGVCYLPTGITYVSEGSFDNCDKVMIVVIPEGVTEIEYQAFADCRNIVAIYLPKSIKTIDYWNFDSAYDLYHILYAGTEEEWNAIDVKDSGNSNFINATKHYSVSDEVITLNVTKAPTCTESGIASFSCSICDALCEVTLDQVEHSGNLISRVPATCTTDGYDVYLCSNCNCEYNANFTNALGHHFIDGACKNCGIHEDGAIESEHNYSNNCDTTLTITKKGANKIAVTFSENTYTEYNCDYIYIYDAEDNLIGKYDGDELANQTIEVDSDTIKIRLTSDSSITAYGFKVVKIEAYYDECHHSNYEIVNYAENSCTSNGYSGDLYCKDCQRIIEYGEVTLAKGHAEGEWKITKPATVTAEGERTLYCSVCGTVIRTEAIPKLNGRVNSVSISDIKMNYKKSANVSPVIDCDEGVNYTVTYETSNPKVATVDENGNVKATGDGSATITCTVTDEFGNTVSDTCTVKVTYAWWQWIIRILLLGFIWY